MKAKSDENYIALFRGINVLGKNILPMKELAALLESLGCRSVRTYIQSGNAVFTCGERHAARLPERIGAAIRESRGFAPRVMILSAADLERVIARNPFPEAAAAPKSLHAFFLGGAPAKAALQKIEALRAGREQFALRGMAFYLHTPDGFGRSKLAANAERALGVPATARNWRTVETVMAMARRE